MLTPIGLVPEQRIADVWNQYVREIEAPDEALVTVAEIHNMRDGTLTAVRLMWERGSQTIWTMPNLFALGSDGKVADGCRAVEAIRVMHDLERFFQNLRAARDRLQRGIVPSEQIKKHHVDPNRARLQSVARLEAHTAENPVRTAEQRYVQQNGPTPYGDLLQRLFEALFPRQ